MCYDSSILMLVRAPASAPYLFHGGHATGASAQCMPYGLSIDFTTRVGTRLITTYVSQWTRQTGIGPEYAIWPMPRLYNTFGHPPDHHICVPVDTSDEHRTRVHRMHNVPHLQNVCSHPSTPHIYLTGHAYIACAHI